MKRTFILIVALFVAFVASMAQTPLPNDPEVRKGKLENGLTYYIRHNAHPAGRAEFYLATHVGAIQETPDQDGLAHFLEHMCFNGTKNLPGKSMLEYLQSIGAEFGRNINAATGVEQTTYMLNNIPVSREGIIDTCLLIMHDYSHFVTCDPLEIDKERGVILEEKRSRDGAMWRIYMKSKPYYYGDTKYADCSLIGSEENLKNFKPESLTNFYHTWYRPDLQAVIVVGDIDVDQIEAKIRQQFSDIPAVENPQPKDVHMIPENEEPIIGIVTDPEETRSSVEIIWKSIPLPYELRGTEMGIINDVLEDLFTLIMDERLSEIASKPNAPFINAGFGFMDLCETCEITIGSLTARDGEAVSAFTALYTEIEKLRRYGITEAEYKRAKDNLIKEYEKQVEGADTRKNSEFIELYIDNFFDGKSYLTPEMELQLVQMICMQLSTPAINQMLTQVVSEENMVVVYTGPEKEGLVQPTREEFLSAIEAVRSSEIAANQEEETQEELLDPASIRGSKVGKKAAGAYGSTIWTLKNGVKVVVLPTQYKKDEVLIKLTMKGGQSIVDVDDLNAFESNIFGLWQRNSGVSKFTATALSKMLAGKSVSVSPYVAQLNHGINASCSPKDLETALQLVYLQFTDPRFDPDEFNLGIEQLKAMLPNLIGQPDYIFQQKIYEDVFEQSPRNINLSEEVLEKADVKNLENAFGKLFHDACGATVYIIGNVDLDSLKPMVEKYIGALGKGKVPTKYNLENVRKFAKGEIADIFKTKMQAPKETVLQVRYAEVDYSIEKEAVLDAANFILDMIYVETLREEEGGTYGASSVIELNRLPVGHAIVQVYFNTNSEQVNRLRALAIEGLEKLATEGPTEAQVSMAVENAKKNLPEKRISNKYWCSNLQELNEFGTDRDKEYEAAISKISVESIKAAVAEILASGNFIEIVMGPQE